MKEKKNFILIVDDIQDNIQLLGNILSEAGYNVAAVNSGQDALDILNANTPELILLDVMMPGMDGFEVCKIIKNSERLRDIPVIFITAKANKEDVIKGFQVGGVDYITKPFNTIELLARVKVHLENHRLKNSLLESNQTKDKFFSIIAHDLKGPLGGIFSLIDIINSSTSPENISKYINVVKSSLKSAYNLLENLLNWARLETKTMQFDFQKLDLLSIISNSIVLLKNIAMQKNIALSLQNIDSVIVWADNNMLETIIRNLISNALKFTPFDGEVSVWYEEKENHVEVNIQDTGLGISPENIDKLFRLDLKYSTSGTNGEKGTGLGLILCKEMIETIGGEIWLNSELGKGTTFTFTLQKPKDYPEKLS